MIPVAARQQTNRTLCDQHTLLINAGNCAATDVVRRWTGGTATIHDAGDLDRLPLHLDRNLDTVVVMVRHPWCHPGDPLLHRVVKALRNLQPKHVCFVTGCVGHFVKPPHNRSDGVACDSQDARPLDRLESYLQSAVPDTVSLTVVRCGFVVDPESETAGQLKRLSWLNPLLPPSVRSTFVTGDELAGLLASPLVQSPQRPFRSVTLLGRNRPWQDVLSDIQATGRRSVLNRMLSGFASILRLLGTGYLIHGVLLLLCRLWPQWRVLAFDTVTPRSEWELLSLCHQHNRSHVAVCGYNNGVHHFGWNNGERTNVPTVRSGRMVHIDGDTVTVDAGTTLKQCVDVLRDANRELYVVPNYSYISMGTAFFVPVHGSGSEVSTLGDTIDWVRLYDPATDSVVEAQRGEPLFQQTMYDMHSAVVVLQLRLKIRKKSQYRVEQTEYSNPSAANVWALLNDLKASNIEIRKHRATDEAIQVCMYYPSNRHDDGELQVPRDAIGSLWDRLEENRVTAFLFHWLVRNLAFHVELFLREDEFAVFWEHHQALPISKLQLRMVRRDGMPNSAFCHEDCVSADLFMMKRHRQTFLRFAAESLPGVRFNPGKQSMRGRDE